MREEFRPAIEALQRDLADHEAKVIETKTTINKLCEVAGEPPLYPDVGEKSQPSITNLRADTFYGKVLTTAAREYLEMRKAANLGPATPREVYEALLSGGFAFDAKDETNAISGVRQTLRKNSSIFHRLPNGEYGLLAWYPKAKKPKQNDDEDEEDSNSNASPEDIKEAVESTNDAEGDN